ncbi:MAG: hypothetical protein IT424_04430 [Pirellulales bacterium]|nr:hypothetical protein [Pirellulales bacterium]
MGAIVVVLTALGLIVLFSLRTRPLTIVVIVALAAGIFLLARGQTSSHVVVGRTVWSEPGGPRVGQPWRPQEQQLARARQQAEILKNQRLAARMSDATVQASFDGSELETYPDGMQVKQQWATGKREIIREADDLPGGSFYTPFAEGAVHTAHFSFAVLAIPLGVLSVAFLLLRKGRNGCPRKGSGWSWIGVGAGMLLVGGLFVGGSRAVHKPAPLVEALPQLPPQPLVQPAIGDPLAEALPEAIEEFHDEVQDHREDFKSLDSIWSHLTAPRINLAERSRTLEGNSQRELAEAARLVLAQSLPAADPFTQGWLTNAAKAIVQASKAVAGEANDGVSPELMAAVQPEVKATPGEAPMVEMPPGSPAQAETTAAPVATARASAEPQAQAEAIGGRPDWLDQPTGEHAGVYRVVVSTDQFATVEECRAQLENRLRYAVADRVRQSVSKAIGHKVLRGPMLADMGVDAQYICRVLCVADYVEIDTASGGQRQRVHALLQVTPQQDAAFVERWQAAMRGEHPGPMYAAVAAAKPFVKKYTTDQRPEWVDQPPGLVGNARRMVVSTDPFSTVEECYVQLEDRLRYAVADRVRQLAQQVAGRPVASGPSLDDMGVGSDYILRELCPEPDYVETVKASFGEMLRAHALLEFTPQQDEFLLDRWKSAMRTKRVASVAGLGACLLGGLACALGLLKVDTWTRGFYTKRLFIGVPAAIIGVGLAMGVLLGLIG